MTRPSERQIHRFTAFQYIGVMSAEHFHGYLSMRSRGLIAMLAVPATERWFWTDESQAGEQEVDAHVRAGELKVTKDADEFLGSLPGGSA